MIHNYPSREIAHVWVHDGESIGFAKSPGNASFSGGVFFSYGTAMAERITIKGQRIMLVNNDSYSVSTSKTQSWLRQAISHCEQIHVSDIDMGSSTLLDSYKPKQWAREQVKASLKRAGRLLLSAKRRRSSDLADDDRRRALNEMNQARLIRELFDKRISVPDCTDSLAASAERAAKAEARRDKAEQKRLAIKHAEQIEQWLDGTGHSIPYGASKVYLRVLDVCNSPDGKLDKEIQTSQGARIPYADGERCFRFAIARRSKGWKRNGERFSVGQYALDMISKKGIHAGCHLIEWPIIEAFAKAEGWVK